MIIDATDENEVVVAKTLLLKAAKMDTTKPDPFALLGIWYELHNDSARARGCYQKALAINPSHPIAGRGLLRLVSLNDIQPLCKKALQRNSPSNGWAWRALGRQRSQGEGDDTAAVVCFQQALRCRDVQALETDILGVFYLLPAPLGKNDGSSEARDIWVELAACYRRLGKYSAALRAFEAAFFAADGNLSPDALCAWAQVNLDLGLYEAATDTCAKVLSMETTLHVKRMASFIEGEALLFLARSCIQEGKFGSCLMHLEKGAARLKALSTDDTIAQSHYCEIKLLGDIYSCGNSLPSYVFSQGGFDEKHSEHENNFSHDVENQLSFLVEGEHAYYLALEIVKAENGHEEDDPCLRAAAATDLGTNLLSQARVILLALGESSGGDGHSTSSSLVMNSCRLKDLITRSVNAYLYAIDSSPHDASAWCGLGCALIAVDPMISQHAFCRAIEIDSSLADSWSNISLFYACHDKEKSSEILDYITQVEDNPLMWIGRGFLLEETAREWIDDELVKEACLTKAADAYRSALQLRQHPAALLGLSWNCRRADPRLKASNNLEYSFLADNITKFESKVSLCIYQNMTPCDIGASFVGGLTQLEEGLNRLDNIYCLEAVKKLDNALTRLKSKGNILHPSEPVSAQCEIDLTGGNRLRVDKAEEVPDDEIKFVLDHALIATSGNNLNIISEGADKGLSEARNKLLLNPESGEAWLIFAGHLAHDVNDANMISTAKIAAKRAYELFYDRIVYAAMLTPRRPITQGKSIEFSDTTVISSLPSASLFSYSMALVSSIGMAKDSERLNISPMALSAMQESLLLDPLNSIATAMLQTGSPTKIAAISS